MKLGVGEKEVSGTSFSTPFKLVTIPGKTLPAEQWREWECCLGLGAGVQASAFGEGKKIVPEDLLLV